MEDKRPDENKEFFITGLLVSILIAVVCLVIYLVVSSSPWLTGLTLVAVYIANWIIGRRKS